MFYSAHVVVYIGFFFFFLNFQIQKSIVFLSIKQTIKKIVKNLYVFVGIAKRNTLLFTRYYSNYQISL